MLRHSFQCSVLPATTKGAFSASPEYPNARAGVFSTDSSDTFPTPASNGRGIRNNQNTRVTGQVEELAYSNMMTLIALVDLLEEKGVVTEREVLGRIKQLQDLNRKSS